MCSWQPFKVSKFEKCLTKEIEFRADKVHPPKDFAREDKEAFDDTPAKEPVSVPAFYQKLENFQLVEGADATFVCKVNARPLPQVSTFQPYATTPTSFNFTSALLGIKFIKFDTFEL